MANFLNPLKSCAKPKSLWGFDIETDIDDKNNFVMGSIFGDCNINKTFWDKNKFLSYIKNNRKIFNNGYITATNLQFDLLALLENTEDFNNFYPIIRNSKMIYAHIKSDSGHLIKFIDTMNFAYFSVEKWGRILNIPKLEKPECFGSFPKNESEKLHLEHYNIRDSEITYNAIKLIQNRFNDLGSELKITISSSALDLYKRKYLKYSIMAPNKKYIELLYKSYYGGRTEAIKRGKVRNLKIYDVNSMYGYSMLNEYPNPNYMKYCKNITLKNIMEFEGVAKVRLRLPYLYIPYLPLRSEKLIFPYGEYMGSYTFFELRKAIDYGYEILKIYEGIIYFKKLRLFNDFVMDLYNKKQDEFTGNSPFYEITKKILNSLYGKFAQKIDYKEKIIHESKVTTDMLEKSKDFFRSGNFFIFKEKYNKIPSFINPIFSIYTTAYARDTLYNYLMKNKDEIYYYDTDSLFTSSYFENSNKLGKLKLCKIAKEGIIIKPKMYLLDNETKVKGLWNIDKNDFMGILESKKANMRRLVKFKEGNKRNLKYNSEIIFIKELDLEDDKRLWEEKFSAEKLQISKPLEITV